jgi:hypothetical protein
LEVSVNGLVSSSLTFDADGGYIGRFCLKQDDYENVL